MTEADLAHIEARLGPIPAEYRRFLLGSDDWWGLRGVPYGVEALIRENTNLRRWPEDWGVMQPDGTSVPWPAGWWAVSDNGGGDHWFVRDDDEGRSVWFWNHESGEVREAAPTIDAFLAEGREDRASHARPAELIDHPTLGPLTFDGSSYDLDGPMPVSVQVGWLHADPSAQRAVLDAAARLIPEALAAERRVFESALPRLVALQDEPVSWEPDLPRLDADRIRERLIPASLNVHADRSGDGFALRLTYVYAASGGFAWDYLEIACGPDLSVREVGPL